MHSPIYGVKLTHQHVWKLIDDITSVCIFFPGSVALTSAAFGEGVGSIGLVYVQCNGGESSLLSCPYSAPHRYCYHYEDSGVRCHARTSKST